MDPDDLQLIQAYLQGGPSLGQQPPQLTTAQVTADILDAWGGGQGGSSQTLTSGGGPVPTQFQAAQPLTGLYALGAAGLTGDALDNPVGYYDDNAPDYSASPTPSSNPNLVLTANRPTPSGVGPSSASSSASIGPLGQAGQMQSPAPPTPPSPQDQDAAKSALQSQGQTPFASYNDRYLDAEANIAQGRVVAPGEPQPDLGPWSISTDSPQVARQKQLIAEDTALLQDPRVRAYLDTIAYSEGYFNNRPTEYDSLFGDGINGKRLVFGSYDAFPDAKGMLFKGAPSRRPADTKLALSPTVNTARSLGSLGLRRRYKT